MRSRVLLTTLALLALAMPASASGVTLVNPDGTTARPFQRWTYEMDVPPFDARITITRDLTICQTEDLPLGCATTSGVIALGSLPGLYGWRRHVLYHELGHEFDYQMPEWKRGVFRHIMGADPAAPWRLEDGSLSPLAESFAEIYAVCADNRMSISLSLDPNAPPPPTGKQVRRTCRLIQQSNS